MKHLIVITGFLLILQQPVAYADISGKTEGVQGGLESHLEGGWTEALVDAGQLGLALSSYLTGKSFLISPGLAWIGMGTSGVDAIAESTGTIDTIAAEAAPYIHIYGAYTTAVEFFQLLDALGDRSAFQEGYLKLSQEGNYTRGGNTLTFTVKSDDDPFGIIRADVKQISGIEKEINGVGTKHGYARVTFHPEQLQEGLYPVVFFAKEDDCAICLMITHAVLVHVYDPCPGLGKTCQSAKESLDDARNLYKAAWNRYRVIIRNGLASYLRIQNMANACLHAQGKTATGGGSSTTAQDTALEQFDACMDDVDRERRVSEGMCPDLVFGATQSECDQLAERQSVLDSLSQNVREAVDNFRSLNCCDEFVNPNGNAGPGGVGPIVFPGEVVPPVELDPDRPVVTIPGEAVTSGATCQEAVQGKIAWDYKGSKTWSPNNVERLCHDANSDQPARCFQRVMHGGVNWGGGDKWQWGNAIDLCEGTSDADATIRCFQQKIGQGQSWQNAIATCN